MELGFFSVHKTWPVNSGLVEEFLWHTSSSDGMSEKPSAVSFSDSQSYWKIHNLGFSMILNRSEEMIWDDESCRRHTQHSLYFPTTQSQYASLSTQIPSHDAVDYDRHMTKNWQSLGMIPFSYINWKAPQVFACEATLSPENRIVSLWVSPQPNLHLVNQSEKNTKWISCQSSQFLKYLTLYLNMKIFG